MCELCIKNKFIGFRVDSITFELLKGECRNQDKNMSELIIDVLSEFLSNKLYNGE